MGVLSWISGLFKPAQSMVEVFKENKEKQAQRHHEQTMALNQQDMASLQQYATEFIARERRTWWDSVVDGLNRLPRPMIVLGVLFFFILAPSDPVYFLQIAQAYEAMPEGFWALLSIIVAFYFGGRMQLKSQDFKIKGNAVQAAKDMVTIRREFRELAREDQPLTERTYRAALADEGRPLPNRVIQEWNRRRKQASAQAEAAE